MADTPRPSFTLPVPDGRTPLVAVCAVEDCRYVWIAVWLPMEMMRAATIMKSLHCPLCGHDAPGLASAEDAGKIEFAPVGAIVAAHPFAEAIEAHVNEAPHG